MADYIYKADGIEHKVPEGMHVMMQQVLLGKTSEKDIADVSVHEAGHAMIAIRNWPGIKATWCMDGDSPATRLDRETINWDHLDWCCIRDNIGLSLAGYVAQMVDRGIPESYIPDIAEFIAFDWHRPVDRQLCCWIDVLDLAMAITKAQIMVGDDVDGLARELYCAMISVYDHINAHKDELKALAASAKRYFEKHLKKEG